MDANLWSANYSLIKDKLGNDLPSILTVGNKALFKLRIEFHKIYGIKVNILDIDSSFSYGEIEKLKQETISKLKVEGIFNHQKRLYLPVIAKRIALIGSPGTSGYRDFINGLTQNPVYRKFTVKEFQTTVQGDGAAPKLIEALKEARTYDVDVIVIIRGGGSKMDLNVFNDYELSREICLTKIPVLTGIGHETDEVVVDLVCSYRCITPTAVAKHLYVQIGMFTSNLQKAFDAVKSHSVGQLSIKKEEFAHLNKYFVFFSQQLIHQSSILLRNESHKLHVGFLDIVGAERSQLELLLSRSVFFINPFN